MKYGDAVVIEGILRQWVAAGRDRSMERVDDFVRRFHTYIGGRAKQVRYLLAGLLHV